MATVATCYGINNFLVATHKTFYVIKIVRYFWNTALGDFFIKIDEYR